MLAQTLAADVVVTPDTGPAWAVAKMPMRKIVLLSHASQENITKGWKNTLTLHADATVTCWPCHLLIDRPEDCERVSGRKVESGVACISSIKSDAVIEAVRKRCGQPLGVKHGQRRLVRRKPMLNFVNNAVSATRPTCWFAGLSLGAPTSVTGSEMSNNSGYTRSRHR